MQGAQRGGVERVHERLREGGAREGGVGRVEADARPGVPAGALHPGIRAHRVQGGQRAEGRGGGARGVRERAARSLGDYSRAQRRHRAVRREG